VRPVPAPPPWATSLATVGVTGTNGKTTTTTWIAACLEALAARDGTGPIAQATTLGFALGGRALDVPRSFDGFLAGMRAAADAGGRYAAVELTSEALAHGFARAWPFAVGVFTNLTHDHLDAHRTPEHYLASKAQLFLALREGGTAVLNASDPTSELLRDVLSPHVRVLSYAVPGSRGPAHGEPDVVATSVDVSWSGTRVSCRAKDAAFPTELYVRAVGDVFAENALAALLGAVALGAAPEAAARALAAAAPPPGRFEIVHERPHVVVDYAHTPDALARTLATARRLATAGNGRDGRLTVVFGAGGDRDRQKRRAMGEAARLADRVVLTADNPRSEDPRVIADAIASGLVGHGAVVFALDRREAIRRAVLDAAPQDVVLVAGRGHEKEQDVRGMAVPLSDVDVVRAALGVSPAEPT